MRLWHYKLIPFLPRQQLLGQHRECCALRGLGWGKKHATVDYVFKRPYEFLVAYHWQVIDEMERRGYKPNNLWFDAKYRGKKKLPLNRVNMLYLKGNYYSFKYKEHNDLYLDQCLDNLRQKGIDLYKHFLEIKQ